MGDIGVLEGSVDDLLVLVPEASESAAVGEAALCHDGVDEERRREQGALGHVGDALRSLFRG